MERRWRGRDTSVPGVICRHPIPKIDGYEVCRQLRQFDWGRRIRVIARPVLARSGPAPEC
jgi:CheY-like chemotaxis protein